MNFISDEIDVTPAFNLFFGRTTHECTTDLMEANAELVLHSKVTQQFHFALQFLKSLLAEEGQRNRFSYAHWTYQLAWYMGERVTITQVAAVMWEDWQQWLEPNVAMLERVIVEPGNRALIHEAQTLLSAWHHLISDHHQELRR